MEDEVHAARAKLNEARYGVAEPAAWRIRVGPPKPPALRRHRFCPCKEGCTFEYECGEGCPCPRVTEIEKCRAERPADALVDAGWSLTTVKIKAADSAESERTCALQGATYHVFPSETPKYFCFGIDVETRSVDCRLEAMGQDEEWIEIWQGKGEVAGQQSPWIPFPTVPYGQKTLQFRYVKVGDTFSAAVEKLEGRTSLLRTLEGDVNSGNIFDFEQLCQVRRVA